MTRWKAKKSNQKNLKIKGKGQKQDIIGEKLYKKMGEILAGEGYGLADFSL